MQLTLTRSPSDGLSVRGTLSLSGSRSPSSPALASSSPASSSPSPSSNGVPSFQSGIPTLENARYLIPCGTYPLVVTYSPRFKRLMPLVCNVVGAPDDPRRPRSGIRFHPGTRPEHSQGCILVSRAHEDLLCNLIQKEKVTLKIVQL